MLSYTFMTKWQDSPATWSLHSVRRRGNIVNYNTVKYKYSHQARHCLIWAGLIQANLPQLAEEVKGGI